MQSASNGIYNIASLEKGKNAAACEQMGDVSGLEHWGFGFPRFYWNQAAPHCPPDLGLEYFCLFTHEHLGFLQDVSVVFISEANTAWRGLLLKTCSKFCRKQGELGHRSV